MKINSGVKKNQCIYLKNFGFNIIYFSKGVQISEESDFQILLTVICKTFI